MILMHLDHFSGIYSPYFCWSSESAYKLVMGGSESNIEFAIKTNNQFYFAGQEVTGVLYVNAKKKSPCVRIVLEVEGTESCEFTTEDKEIMRGQKRLISTHFIMREFSQNHVLEGQYEFPFKFRFLQYLPGTFNESKGYKAQVNYFIRAIIQPSFKSQEILDKRLEIIIREPQREGERVLYQEVITSIKTCFFCRQGDSRVSCYFEKNYYFPKEECIMVCEVDNTRCQTALQRVQCKFIKQLTLTALNGTEKVITEELNTAYFPGVGAGQSYFGQNAQRLTLKLCQKNSQAGLTPSTHGRYVRCEYFILVEPQYSGWFNEVTNRDFKVCVDILQPSMNYEAIPQPDHWRPSVEEPSNIILDYTPENDMLSSMNL